MKKSGDAPWPWLEAVLNRTQQCKARHECRLDGRCGQRSRLRLEIVQAHQLETLAWVFEVGADGLEKSLFRRRWPDIGIERDHYQRGRQNPVEGIGRSPSNRVGPENPDIDCGDSG